MTCVNEVCIPVGCAKFTKTSFALFSISSPMRWQDPIIKMKTRNQAVLRRGSKVPLSYAYAFNTTTHAVDTVAKPFFQISRPSIAHNFYILSSFFRRFCVPMPFVHNAPAIFHRLGHRDIPIAVDNEPVAVCNLV